MHQISFGSVLKEARLAQGRDLASVSRDLRIRQDIIVSIENSDFKRMPSRGYARNMIIAYSRLLGLNAQDVSRMYLDQEYAYQVERAHQNVDDSIRMHRDPHGRERGGYNTSSFSKVDGRSSRKTRSRISQPDEKDLYDGSSNGFGRAVYSQNADVYPSHNNPQVAHRARRSAMPAGKYGNMYAAPQNIPNPNRNRNIVIGIVVGVVIVVALVIAMVLSHPTTPQTNIPVTGAQVYAELRFGFRRQPTAGKHLDGKRDRAYGIHPQVFRCQGKRIVHRGLCRRQSPGIRNGFRSCGKVVHQLFEDPIRFDRNKRRYGDHQ